MDDNFKCKANYHNPLGCTKPAMVDREICRDCYHRVNSAMLRTLRHYGERELADELEYDEKENRR